MVYISIKHNLMVDDFPFIVIHFTSLVDNASSIVWICLSHLCQREFLV